MARVHAWYLRLTLGLALAGGVATAGCSSTQEAAPGEPYTCVPGQATACACSDGASGSQVCDDSGKRYAACVCEHDAGIVDASVEASDASLDADAGSDGADASDATDGSTFDVPDATAPRPGPLCGCPSGQMHCPGTDKCVPLAPTCPGASACLGCAPQNAVPSCVGGACAIALCVPGWSDCDGDPTNGCEADIVSGIDSCGGCGRSCDAGQVCTGGACVAGPCAPPNTNCNGACVDLRTSVQYCGACAIACSPAEQCDNGGCVPVAPVCTTCGAAGCVDLQQDVDNCGSCGHKCPTSDNTFSRACLSGQCQPCPPGLTACQESSPLLVLCADTTRERFNCGTCGHECGDGETCWNSVCVPSSSFALVSDQSSVSDLVADANGAYWVDEGQGIVATVAVAGSAAVTLATDQVHPVHLAVDATHVYWANQLGGAVMRVTKAPGGTPEIVAATPEPTFVSVDDTTLYWVSRTDAKIFSAPKDGSGVPTELAHLPSAPTLFAANKRSLVTGAWGGSADVVTVTPRAGGPSNTLRGLCPRQFATLSADDDDLYFACQSDQRLQASKLGYAAASLLWGPYPNAPNANVEGSIVAEAGDVFFLVGGAPHRGRRCELGWADLEVDLTVYLLALSPSYLWFSDGHVVGRVPR